MISSDSTIAVVGLGYVGLPLAVEFGKTYKTIGYDVSPAKIAAYQSYRDPTGELTHEELQAASRLDYTADPSRLSEADYIIVAVPTPINQANQPDFEPLVSASEVVGKFMKPGTTIIYESTVYPGATEEVCIPHLERASGMKWRDQFNVGYSPERINPGDKERTLTKILKIVSGDSAETLERVGALYGSIIKAGIYRASCIKVAEAAKVIENTQRDLNIALMNELAIIFDRIGIDTSEVLAAAGTKWNFLEFKPGLVGGHCIGVDPYYLTYKSEALNYHPQVILAGRRINDGMGKFIAEKTVKLMALNKINLNGARVNVLGLTFKEDCPDLRNSKVVNLIRELEEFGCNVSVHDPIADSREAEHEYGVTLLPWDNLPLDADAVVIAVAHTVFRQMMANQLISSLRQPDGVVVDVKAVLDPSAIRNTVYRL